MDIAINPVRYTNNGYWSTIMRKTGISLLGIVPGMGLLLASDDNGSTTTVVTLVISAIGVLIAGVMSSISLMRKQDTDSAIKGMQIVLDRQENTINDQGKIINDLQNNHSDCQEKYHTLETNYNKLESKVQRVGSWMKRNKSTMEKSGVPLEDFPSIE